MGMFNYITDVIETPCCSVPQRTWQSKSITIRRPSGKKVMVDNVMNEFSLPDIYLGEIHNICRRCGKYVRGVVERGEITWEKDK